MDDPRPDASPERWQRLQQILDEVLERPADERAACIAAACAGDAALHDELSELLALSAEADTFFGLPALAPIATFEEVIRDEHVTDRLAGRTLGAYRLVREIGRGGMGTVYLAERADEHFRKTVALKLVRRGMDTDEVLGRFRNERQILASLDHPGIARLYDGGVTDDGLPFFVMEYIEGRPITDYCDAHRLSVADRLRLFADVCAAVHHAHRNFVVHCDLKPTNILVTEAGEVKLLDFGIAKLLDPNRPESVLWTRPGERYLTPEYAAPEQLRGEVVTTATDVYALGVLLYQLLSGHRPYQLRGLLPSDLERTICEVVPPRPSTRVLRAEGETVPAHVAAARATTAKRLSRQLAGDLDTVVATALRKEPSARYGSPARLAEDVRRHLEGRPVLARPDAAAYRALRFVRRHAVSVTLATVALLSLVTGLVAASWQAHVAAQERDRARRAAEEARHVSAFLVGLFEEIDPSTDAGRATTARELLDRGAAKADSTLGDQPEVQATLLDAIGRVYRSLGLYPEARPLLERALAIRQQTFGPEHPAVAESLHNLGYFAYTAGLFPEADSLFRLAARQRRQLLPGDDPDLASGLGDFAVLLRRMGHYAEAEAITREVLAIERRRARGDTGNLPAALVNLGGILIKRERFAEAEAVLREAQAAYARLLGPGHLYVGVAMNSLGTAVLAQGRYDEADRLLRDALAHYRRGLPEDHPWMAYALASLGRLHYERGDRAAALATLEESLARRRRALAPTHPDVADALAQLGRVYLDGAPADALPPLREALAIREGAFGTGSTQVAEVQSLLGAACTRLGRYAEAEALLRGALPRLGAEELQLRRETRARLAALYDAWGRPTDGDAYRGTEGAGAE